MAKNQLEVQGVGTEDYGEWEGARTPQKSIKDFCKSCMGDNYSEVKHCSSIICPLKPFRTGKNPFREGRIFTDEEKAVASERLREARNRKTTKETPDDLSWM